ncbi:MAG: glucose/sorbosone dehydrogenase, partial [Pedobacter sp.]
MKFILISAVSFAILASCNGNNAEKKTNTIIEDTTSVQLQDTTTVDNSPAVESAESQSAIAFNTTDISEYDSTQIQLASGVSFNVAVMKGYHINVAAEGLKRLRFLTLSPDKRLFVTDMYDKSDNHKGKVLVFEEWDEASKSFGKVSTYLDQLHNPNQVAFYNNYIYVAETDKLSRYTYQAGDVKPSSEKEVIASFPAYGLSYKYGGWHLTRSIAFHNDKLYVSVGSSCNACIESEEVRASVIEMDPDGKNAIEYARGLRNSVGMKWIGDELWVTGMGRDLIGPDKPEDLFLK